MKGTQTYRLYLFTGLFISPFSGIWGGKKGLFAAALLAFTLHCGSATSIFEQADPVIYNGSLKTAPQAQPNLSIELLSLTGEGSSTERGKTIVASVKINNPSQTAITESFFVTAFLTPQIATDRHWAQSWQIASLAAQQSKILDVTFTVPSSTSTGNYKLEYIVDYANRISEYDETDNNLGPYTMQIVERSFKPDLFSNVLNYNATLKTLSLRISNNGGGIGKEIFFYKVYLSHNDQTLDSEDMLLYVGDNFTSNQFIEVPHLGFFEEIVPLAAFSTEASGDYYLLIKVDSDDLIPESNEDNNLFGYFILSQP